MFLRAYIVFNAFTPGKAIKPPRRKGLLNLREYVEKDKENIIKDSEHNKRRGIEEDRK